MTVTDIPAMFSCRGEFHLSGDHTPEQLAAAKITGYHNYFRVGVFEAQELVQSLAPAGWRATVIWLGSTPPAGAVRVGQVKVNSGGCDYPLVIYPIGKRS